LSDTPIHLHRNTGRFMWSKSHKNKNAVSPTFLKWHIFNGLYIMRRIVQ